MFQQRFKEVINNYDEPNNFCLIVVECNTVSRTITYFNSERSSLVTDRGVQDSEVQSLKLMARGVRLFF